MKRQLMSTFAILALAGSGLAVTANSASAAASALSCKVVFDDSPSPTEQRPSQSRTPH
jgi:hypothetical protein